MTKAAIGAVLRWDFQSDVFRGEYRLVENLGEGTWLAEYLEPSDELIAEAVQHYLESERPYLGYVDPFGPGRREATRQEALDQEILERIERVGQTFKIRFVPSEQYHAMF